jgi:hypothetical protein
MPARGQPPDQRRTHEARPAGDQNTTRLIHGR